MFSRYFPILFLVFLIAILLAVEIRNRSLRRQCIFRLKTRPKGWYMQIFAVLVFPLVPMVVSTMTKIRLANVLQGSNPIQKDFVRNMIINEYYYWGYMIVFLLIVFIYSLLSQKHSWGIFTEEGFIYRRYFKYDKLDHYILDHKYGYVEVYYKIIYKWQGQVLIKVEAEECQAIAEILENHGVQVKKRHL